MQKNNKGLLQCGKVEVNALKLGRVKEQMPKEATLIALTDLFKTLGDSTRARILFGLSVCELCVCDLAELIGLSISAASHQLKALKQAGLVKFRRDGKNIFYTLDDEHVSMVFSLALEHVNEAKK